MVFIPVSQALVARFAPADMRGRYMTFFGFAWTIPMATGSLAAGLIMDNLAPELVWFAAAFLGLLAAVAYGVLHLRIGVRSAASPPVPAGPATGI